MATVGAVMTARGVVDRLAAADGAAVRPAQTGVGKFFTDNYRVGAEGVRADIPQLVLLETGLKAAVIARKCLFGAVDGGAGVGRGLVARATGALLGVSHAVTALVRRAPAHGGAAIWAIVAASVTLLGVGLWQGLTRGVADWGVVGWTVFGVAPLLALAATAVVTGLRRRQHEPRLESTSPGPGSAAAS